MHPVATIRHEGREFSIRGFSEEDLLFKRWQRSGRFYELDLLTGIRSIAKEGVFIDAGAHVGNHSIFFNAFCKCTTLVAVEPGASSYSLLSENLKANFPGEQDWIKAVRFILDEIGVGSKSLADIDNSNTASRSVVCNGNEKCDCITIDQLIENLGIAGSPVSCLKIDTEGMELQVLRGSRETIERWRPIVAAEASSDEDRIGIGEFLSQFGYHQTKIKKKRGVPSYVWACEQ
jgi:FkbM family methyltransferase